MCNWKDSSEALFQWVSAHLHFTWFQVGTLTELFTKQGNKIPDKALSLSHRFWWAERHESHSATGNACWSNGQIRKNSRKRQTWLSRKYVLNTKWTGWYWNFTVAQLSRFQRGFFPCSTLKSKSKSKLLGEEVGLRSCWPRKRATNSNGGNGLLSARCLGNDGVSLGFGSGEGSLVESHRSHRSFRFIMKHYQTWLIEFHDLIHACRSSKVLPINRFHSFLNMFKHANACQCRLKDVAGLSITWTRFSRCGCELPTRSWDSGRSLKRTWHQTLVIWVGACRLQNPRSRNLESKPTQGNVSLSRLTTFNHLNEQNLLAWQSGSSPRQLAPLFQSFVRQMSTETRQVATVWPSEFHYQLDLV